MCPNSLFFSFIFHSFPFFCMGLICYFPQAHLGASELTKEISSSCSFPKWDILGIRYPWWYLIGKGCCWCRAGAGHRRAWTSHWGGTLGYFPCQIWCARILFFSFPLFSFFRYGCDLLFPTGGPKLPRPRGSDPSPLQPTAGFRRTHSSPKDCPLFPPKELSRPPFRPNEEGKKIKVFSFVFFLPKSLLLRGSNPEWSHSSPEVEEKNLVTYSSTNHWGPGE